MTDRHLLGLDIGTSSTKAVIIDAEGRVNGSGSAPHRLLTPRPGWTEQAPEEWWSASCAAIRGAIARCEIDAKQVAAVGLSGQMHGAVLLDAGREVIRPALLWNDQRTGEHLASIEAAAGGEFELIRRTGNAANTGFQAPKLLWVARNEPELFARIRRVLLPKDYIRFMLTSNHATDVGDASGTLLFDLTTRKWMTDVIQRLGLEPEWFGDVLESGSIAGEVTPAAADATGLRVGTPVVAGSGDNQCGAIGAGVVSPGHGLVILGTSGVVFAPSSHPRPHTDGPTPGLTHAMCAADGSARALGTSCVTGVSLSAAGALHWFRDVAAPGMPFDELLDRAWRVPAGAQGIRCVPQLAGERCPVRDANARGSFHGLSLSHTRDHLTRAVVEGVAFGLVRTIEVIRGLGVSIDRLRAVGGGARSRQWLSIIASLAGLPIDRLTAEEGGAFGAALLAGVGVREWPDVREACAATITVADTVEAPAPEEGLSEGYRDFVRLIAR